MKDKKKFGRGRIQPKLIQKPSYKAHGGMMEKARYYQKGAKVAGCMPAQNNPRMTKAK